MAPIPTLDLIIPFSIFAAGYVSSRVCTVRILCCNVCTASSQQSQMYILSHHSLPLHLLRWRQAWGRHVQNSRSSSLIRFFDDYSTVVVCCTVLAAAVVINKDLPRGFNYSHPRVLPLRKLSKTRAPTCTTSTAFPKRSSQSLVCGTVRGDSSMILRHDVNHTRTGEGGARMINYTCTKA